MLPPGLSFEAWKRVVNRDSKEECLVRHNRPAVVHCTQPSLRIRDGAFERDRLVGEPAVRVPVGDHQLFVGERRAHHGRKVGGVIGDKERGLGDGIELLGNRPPYRLAHPCCPRFTGEDRVEIGELFPEGSKQRALAGAIDPFKRD